MMDQAKNLTRETIKRKKIYLVIWVLKMDKRKRSLNLRGHLVLVQLAVVMKVRRVMILTVNTVIRKTPNQNQNPWTKKINQIMWNENENLVLEIEVDHIQSLNVVGHVQDIGVTHVQDIGVAHVLDVMIEDLRIVIDQDIVDHLYHVMEVTESIKANVTVLLVQMNQEVLNTGTDDNIWSKTNFNSIKPRGFLLWSFN